MEVHFTIKNHSPEMLSRIRAGVAKGLTFGAIYAVGKARANFGTEGGPPSPSGAFPAVETGTLRNSVTHEAATPENLTAVVGTNAKHGRWLEFGWMHANGKAIPARPWLRRTMTREQKRIGEIIAKACAEAFEKGGA